MSAYQPGDRVMIVNSRDKSLIGMEATVTRGVQKRVTELAPSYVIRLDDGQVYHAPPPALVGPLITGYHASPGRWTDCIWQPKVVQ